MRICRRTAGVVLLRNAGAFEKGIRSAESILSFIGMGMLFVLMLLGSSDVIGRYVFNKPILGTLEISQILMAGMVFLGWAHTQAMRANVRMELVISHLPSQVRAIVEFATLFLSLALFSFIAWQAAVIAISYWKEHRLIETIYISSAPFQFLVSFGAFVLCLEFIIQMLHLLPEMRGGG
jgi:TRAP-type C4-dicarboxylate transport system permease small subunit